MTHATRRTFIHAGITLAVMQALPALAQVSPSVHVVKDPGCPCCSGWIGHLRDSGFTVSVEERSVEALEAYKHEQGIPAALVSCHTGTVAGYMLEGHVPAADIRRLLVERPEAIGLAVPGMPYGSPGMGSEAEREAYDVILIAVDGSATIFTSYPAA